MAQIDPEMFTRLEKNCRIQERVQATYTTFEAGGEPFLQIEMYGRSYREKPTGASQIIQMDRESAKMIFDLLKKTFNF